MDRNSFFILLVCFFLLFSWKRISNTIWPPKPVPAQATNQVSTASARNPATASQPTNAVVAPTAIGKVRELPRP